MLRLTLFFLAAFVLASVLRDAPVVGALFRVPILGFWFAAILLSAALAWLAERVVAARQFRQRSRALGQVDTPANRGKLGAFLLASGRPREALPHLAAAHAGEPGFGEWAYRLGEARLAAGDPAGALAALETLLARDEEHAYGRAMLIAARAELAASQPEAALARLARHERNHGLLAEAAFERGRALRALGRRAEARAAFGAVASLVREATRFKRAVPRGLALRAWLARLAS